MDESARFRINSPSVIGESMDGELLIVNLETGAYFSARGTGDVIWAAIELGSSAGEIAALLSARFTAGAGVIGEALNGFLAELISEGLVVEAPAGSLAGSRAVLAEGESGPFVPPALEKFTDMQELLLLDPVHEVEEAGWPHARADLAAAGAAEPA